MNQVDETEDTLWKTVESVEEKAWRIGGTRTMEEKKTLGRNRKTPPPMECL